MIGASPVETDPGRGFRADQWARYTGRHTCAEMIETTARAKLLEKSTSSSKWANDVNAKSKISNPSTLNVSGLQQQQHSGGDEAFLNLKMSFILILFQFKVFDQSFAKYFHHLDFLSKTNTKIVKTETVMDLLV